MHNLIYFTYNEGNLLIRLLLAHIISDFVLQNKWMVENKRPFSLATTAHVLLTFVTAWIISGFAGLSAIIAFTHYVIDTAKASASKRWKNREFHFFLADQLLHVLVIITAWAVFVNKLHITWNVLPGLLTDYKVSLIAFGYAWCIWPAAYIVKFATRHLLQNSDKKGMEDSARIENGGKWIGRLERVLILTLVLLNEYEAIGFLITGKSIIRFVGKDENIKSEYVLLGTLLSYTLAIITGILLNWLL